MDFLTNIIGQRLTIGLKGAIDKNFKISDEIWNILNSNSAISEIIFVLRKIEGVNSSSIDKWVDEMKKVADKGYDLTFIECPKELVEPIIKKGKKFNFKSLKSFVVPYYCDSCNEEYPQLINTSSMSLSFASYSKPVCPTCSKHLALDITGDELDKISSLLPASDAYSDKRKYPRFDMSSYNIKATVYLDTKEFAYKIVNFSEVGVALTGLDQIKAGTRIKMEMERKNGEKVSSFGTVVWSSVEDPPYSLLGVSLESKDIFKELIKT